MASPITSYAQVRNPAVALRVDGEPADDLLRKVETLTITEHVKERATADATFTVDPQGHPLLLDTLLVDERLQNGAVWEIRWGYAGYVIASATFIVQMFDPDFTPEGVIKMKVNLEDRGTHAARDTRAMNWGRVQTSEIAKKIAERYGFETDIEDSNDARRRAYIQAGNMNDFVFLQTLAQRNRFVTYVRNNVLVYRRPRTEEAPAMELRWATGDPTALMTRFHPKIKEPKRRRTQTSAADDDNHQESTTGGDDQSHGARSIVFSQQQRTWWEERTGVATHEVTAEEEEQSRRRIAHARQRSALEQANEASVSAIGWPQLRPDLNVEITGVGPQLGGTWFVRGATHRFQNGGSYTTELDIVRGALAERLRNRNTTEEDGNENAQEAAEEEGSSNGEWVLSSTNRTYWRADQTEPETP